MSSSHNASEKAPPPSTDEPDSKRLRVTTSNNTTKMEQIAQKMVDDTKSKQPFSSNEIDMVIQSLQNVMASNESNVDFDQLKLLIQEVAHESHKNWIQTGLFANRLHKILLPKAEADSPPKDNNNDNNDNDNKVEDDTSSVGSAIEYPSNAPFRTKFERILHEGNWKGAIQSRKEIIKSSTNANAPPKPWIVLVTGVNGIRKTTSVYQPWFTKLLMEALVVPPGENYPSVQEESSLPCGNTSFFRQLDHMIAILANEEFQQLYTLPETNVELYSTYKAGIFTRYRTLSEMLGILLVREAQKEDIHVMVETSGRDIAMFQYADEFFDSSRYRKLVLHFTIQDIHHAEQSVDTRMVGEIRAGQTALKADNNIQDIVNANKGGPYGSKVLKGVQHDSDLVWKSIMDGTKDIGTGWYKATIQIHGKDATTGEPPQPWTANALKPDGTRGTSYEFPVRK